MQAKNILISSLISLGVIVLGTIGFSIYLRFFSRYANLYGSLAGLVVFLLWVYISMFGLVLAPTFNKWFSMRKLKKK
jgi:membrane protein